MKQNGDEKQNSQGFKLMTGVNVNNEKLLNIKTENNGNSISEAQCAYFSFQDTLKIDKSHHRRKSQNIEATAPKLEGLGGESEANVFMNILETQVKNQYQKQIAKIASNDRKMKKFQRI